MNELSRDLDVSREAGGARFSSYRIATENDLQASRLYMWNLSLAARWWGPLAYTEVALRNKIHEQLADSTGTATWWDALPEKVSPQLERSIKDAVRFAGRATKSENPSANDIVAASSFGLWTSCLHKDHAQTLWRHHLAAGFHPTLKRGALFDQAYKLKKLRDRIAHHEPIFAERHETHLKEMRFVLSAIHEDLPRLVEDCFPSLRRTIDGKEAALQHGVVDL